MKKSYKKPVLKCQGSIEELTMALNLQPGNADQFWVFVWGQGDSVS